MLTHGDMKVRHKGAVDLTSLKKISDVFTCLSNLHPTVCVLDKPPSDAMLNWNPPFILPVNPNGRTWTDGGRVLMLLYTIAFCYPSVHFVCCTVACRVFLTALFRPYCFNTWREWSVAEQRWRARRKPRGHSSTLHPSVFLFVFLCACSPIWP